MDVVPDSRIAKTPCDRRLLVSTDRLPRKRCAAHPVAVQSSRQGSHKVPSAMVTSAASRASARVTIGKGPSPMLQGLPLIRSLGSMISLSRRLRVASRGGSSRARAVAAAVAAGTLDGADEGSAQALRSHQWVVYPQPKENGDGPTNATERLG